MLGDAAEDIGEPSLVIDAVELGNLDQGIAPADLLLSEHVYAVHSGPRVRSRLFRYQGARSGDAASARPDRQQSMLAIKW